MNRYDGHEIKDWKPYVGHRCIVINNNTLAFVLEVEIVEISPKGRMKLRFESGAASWKGKNEYLLIEDLGETDIFRRRFRIK